MIRATNLYEKVYDQLKREIFEGRFASEAPALEADLAVRLGVSRTPVREALRILASEDLVVRQPAGGYRAVRIGERDLRDAVAIRVGIETVAVRLAAERATDAQLDGIDAINRRARAALDAGLLGDTMEANEAFHRALAAATGSPLVASSVTRVYEFLLVSRVLDGVREHGRAFVEMARFVGEHEAIAAAVRARDGDLAAERMRAHLEPLGDWYEGSLALAPTEPSDAHGAASAGPRGTPSRSSAPPHRGDDRPETQGGRVTNSTRNRP